MAAVYDWSVPFTLTTPTPQGSTRTLAINQPIMSGPDVLGYIMLDASGCDSGAGMRVTRDDIPQASGEINHRHYKSGYEIHLKAQLWQTIGEGGMPAMRQVLGSLSDLLQLNLNSLVTGDPLLPTDGRLQWTPWGAAVDRMLNPVRLLERPIFTNDGALTAVSFALMSDRPYAWDAPEITSNIPGAGTITLTNNGTADFYPVAKIHGPFNTFTFRNNSLLDANGQPLALVYDASFPGAVSVGSGHYVELDFWRNTAYLDGNVSNLKPGINIAASDFWPIVPGANAIELTGGYTGTGVDILWQNAWA